MQEARNTFTVSTHYDRRLYRQDIAGSVAHARMLARRGIISEIEADAISHGLEGIRSEIEDGSFPWRDELEDIHMNIERRLHETIGDTAGKLHTARSRNDQVALDMRMFAKDAVGEVQGALRGVREALLAVAEANPRAVMPGYTHLQRAQPVLLAHHMLAYFEMLGRDLRRFGEVYRSADVMPLGSGALAGVPYPIDRWFVAEQLGFGSLSRNSLDAVADRDFMLEFQAAAATCMVHLSRLSEELVIWSSDEFAFVRLAGDYTTGSSIMPQKRNPDFAELSRGKTGRVFGNLLGLLTVLKGLPLAYNRDLQEDKEGFFDSFDTLLATLRVFAGMVSTMTVDPVRMREAAVEGYGLATDIADYLVARGMPFREAHGVVARLSAHAYASSRQFHELSLDEYRGFSELFEDDVFRITVDTSVEARDVPGGTAFDRVAQALVEARSVLAAEALE